MEMALIDENSLREKLRKACEAAGSQKIWAEVNEVSPQYVTDVLQGKRGIGDKIANRLGYEKLIRYGKRE